MKYFLVTGVSSGIGEELCQSILEENIDNFVIGLSRNQPDSSIIDKHRNRFKFFSVDFNLPQTIEQIFTDTFFQHLSCIDFVVCNAGSLINKPFSEISLIELQSIYNVNVFSQFLIMQKCIPFLAKSQYASIVTIGSVGGITQSKKFPGLTAYSSSKGALSILTECLAEEFEGSNISFNCLALGSVNTKMLRQAFPDYISKTSTSEIASFIFDFLTSRKKLFNGKTINVSTINT
jgi:NAD(P)-dependent dehydrogenase (short-subunit alcohol dehydrogenase family)